MANKALDRVALMIRDNAPNQTQSLLHTIDQLKQHVTVIVEQNSADQLDDYSGASAESSELSKHADLIIAIGGDGSLIHAATIGLEQNLPVTGINRGRLGFLTDIHPDNTEMLLAIINGKYITEERLLIEVTINKQNPVLALNDVVLSPGMMSRMLEFEVQIDGTLIYQQRADGLIVATPTGSTAYALSGGGPILTPGLDVLTLVPMFPHKLTSRPIVIDANSELQINIKHTADNHAQMSNDGYDGIMLNEGDNIYINKYHKKLQLIHPESYDYYSTLRDKLGWEKANTKK
jgi:NAD+ kinase